MKAMVCEAFGGPEVLALRDVPDPAPPGPGEIQVRIGARGVQYVDVLMLAGKYQFEAGAAFHPGSEAAGEVIAVGPKRHRFQVGDRVMSRHSARRAAPRSATRRRRCATRFRRAMSIEQAGVFRGAYATAYHALSAARPHDRRRMGAGSRRGRRHRHRGDPGGETVRRESDRHREHRSEARGVPRRRRGPRDRLPRAASWTR